MLHVDKVDSLLTEKIRISASNLKPLHCYMFYLKLYYERGLYNSFCVVEADENGYIDLKTAKPIRGTYHEADQMGLFYSIHPSEEVRWGHYFRNSNGKPFIYKLSFLSYTEKVLDSVYLKKRWIHPAVTRIHVAQDGLYGTIFKPPGHGPFPCIIDVPGMNSVKLGTSNAEAFSQSGFLVYTMTMFDHKDLPKTIQKVNVEDYSRHIEFVKSLPYCSGKIGLYGTSFSGTLAIHLALKHPEISAVVAVNGAESFVKCQAYMKENGKSMNCATFDPKLAEFVNGVNKQRGAFQTLFDSLKPETSIQWDKIAKTVSFRIVASIDDWMFPAVNNATRIRDNLVKTGHSVEMEFVTGGHSKNAPYFPHQPYAYNKFVKVALGFGGEASSLGKSQEKVWEKNLEFFRRKLGTPPSLPDYERETLIEKPENLKNKL